MKRVFFVSTSLITVKTFLIEQINSFLNSNYEVNLLTNFQSNYELDTFRLLLNSPKLKLHSFPFSRNLFSKSNFIALKLLLKYSFLPSDLIYTHTPIASFLIRISTFFKDIKIIYFCHGLHFTPNSPFFKKIIYSTVEKLLFFNTSCIITINYSDYVFFSKYFKGKLLYLKTGVGVKNSWFKEIPLTKSALKSSLNLPNKQILISVGEVNANKNHITVLKAIKYLKLDFQYIILGSINPKTKLILDKFISKYALFNVTFLGNVSNPIDYIACSDLVIHPSFREGLPTVLIESIILNKKIAASSIRGNLDLKNFATENIIYFEPKDFNALSKIIITQLTNYDNHSVDVIKIDHNLLETFDRITISESLVQYLVKLYE